MGKLLEKYTDEDLLQLICNDNEAAFAELYRRHVRLLVTSAIRKIGVKSTAEDLVQETFVKFWLKRHSFDINNTIQSYLQGILRHGIISFYHKEQKKSLVSLDEIQNPAVDDTQDSLNLNVLNELYENSLRKLPPKCRSAFELSRKGYSLKEISQQMAISEKTVETHISKALRIMRVEMKDYIALVIIGMTSL